MRGGLQVILTAEHYIHSATRAARMIVKKVAKDMSSMPVIDIKSDRGYLYRDDGEKMEDS